MRRADLEGKRRAYGVQLDAFKSERVREGLGVGERERERERGSTSASARAPVVRAGTGLESVLVVEDAKDVGGLEDFFGEGEGEGEGEGTGVVGVGVGEEVGRRRGRARVEVRRGARARGRGGTRVGVMADEDIEDDEERQWY